MPAKDTRLLRPFVTDADDMYAFDNLDQMKSEITAIYGFDEKKIIRVNRFSVTDTKGRLHWRYISQTQDDTSVEININLSNNPKVKNTVTRYANICTGVPFLNDTGKALHYWNGTEFIELPVALDIYKKFQDSTNERVVDWSRIPIMLNDETELQAMTDIKAGDKFIICNMPSTTTAGAISMYFATNAVPATYPYNTEITTATSSLHVYRVSSLDFASISDGVEDNVHGKIKISDTDVVSGKALKYVQDNMVNKKDVNTIVSQGGTDKVVSAEVVKKLSEKVDSLIVARQAELEVNGVTKKYLYKKRSLFKRKLEAGTNTFEIQLDDNTEEAKVLENIATFMVYTMESNNSTWKFEFNKTSKKLKLTYNKDTNDNNTSILIEVLHKYSEIQ